MLWFATGMYIGAIIAYLITKELFPAKWWMLSKIVIGLALVITFVIGCFLNTDIKETVMLLVTVGLISLLFAFFVLLLHQNKEHGVNLYLFIIVAAEVAVLILMPI